MNCAYAHVPPGAPVLGVGPGPEEQPIGEYMPMEYDEAAALYVQQMQHQMYIQEMLYQQQQQQAQLASQAQMVGQAQQFYTGQ